MSNEKLPEELPESSKKRIGLQVDILNDLMELCSCSEPTLSPSLLAKVNELKDLLKEIKNAEPEPISKVWQEILMTFATKIVDKLGSTLIDQVEILLHPVLDYVSWWNDTPDFVRVRTFDASDRLKWVPFDERVVAPNQAVRLTARGSYIQIHLPSNGATYDCDKNQVYRFDGQNIEPRLS